MAIGDVVELTLHGTVLGQTNLNVFAYEQTAGVGSDGAGGLAAAFEDTIIPAMQAVVTENTGYQSISWVSLNGTFQEGNLALATTIGSRPAPSLPPYAAWAFRLLRTTSESRGGYKRVAGISETDQDNGVYAGTIITQLNALATAFALQLTTTGGNEWTPVIASFILNGVPRTTPVFNPISGAIYQRISTQNSRKFGHGT